VPWILMDHEEKPPIPLGGPDVTKPVYMTKAQADTYLMRLAARKEHARTSRHRRFTNALRAAANAWNALEEYYKKDYTTASQTVDAARPNMKRSPANGWGLWAMEYVGFAMAAQDTYNMTEYFEGAEPAALKGAHARRADGQFDVYFDWTEHPLGHGGQPVFFYQCDMAPYYDKVRTRHTRYLGTHIVPLFPPYTYTVTLDQVFPIGEWGEGIIDTLLVRWPQGIFGTVNQIVYAPEL